ncbi:MAG: ribbon-helix-helix protein, CopG family [Planctomycetota bacterium]
MTTQMLIRLDSDLKNKVARLAKAEGKSVSEVVRDLLEGYLRDRDIGAYIDDLWDRISAKLRSRRRGPGDVGRVLREVRGNK